MAFSPLQKGHRCAQRKDVMFTSGLIDTLEQHDFLSPRYMSTWQSLSWFWFVEKADGIEQQFSDKKLNTHLSANKRDRRYTFLNYRYDHWMLQSRRLRYRVRCYWPEHRKYSRR